MPHASAQMIYRRGGCTERTRRRYRAAVWKMEKTTADANQIRSADKTHTDETAYRRVHIIYIYIGTRRRRRRARVCHPAVTVFTAPWVLSYKYNNIYVFLFFFFYQDKAYAAACTRRVFYVYVLYVLYVRRRRRENIRRATVTQVTRAVDNNIPFFLSSPPRVTLRDPMAATARGDAAAIQLRYFIYVPARRGRARVPWFSHSSTLSSGSGRKKKKQKYIYVFMDGFSPPRRPREDISSIGSELWRTGAFIDDFYDFFFFFVGGRIEKNHLVKDTHARCKRSII